MNRIKSIEIRIPNLTEFEKKENNFLFRILSQLENIKKEERVLIGGREGLYPKLIFKKAEVVNPQISFVTDDAINDSWQVGDLELGFNLPEKKEVKIPRELKDCEIVRDKLGKYTRLRLGQNKYNILSIEQLFDRFSGKLKGLNHAGVGLGQKIWARSDYAIFKKSIADRCNLYRYPTGEEWPFIIPSTDEELLNDISEELTKREPAFEIVYDKFPTKPHVQFDFDTWLPKNEVFALLPSPYGCSLAGLGDYMRTVFILTDWLGVIFRIDIRFREIPYNWIIKEGGRVRK